MKKLILFTLCCTLLLALFAGCGSTAEKAETPAATETPARTDVVIGTTSSNKTLMANMIGNNTFVLNVFDTLYHWDVYYGEMTPAIAKDYALSEDGTVITFYLRDDVKFSDGNPVTAEDVAFTFGLAKESPYTMGLFGYMASAEAVDATTVQVTLLAPSPAMLYNLTGYWTGIVEKSVYEADPEAYAAAPISCGAYKLEELGTDYIKLTANEYYYGGETAITDITVQTITSPEACTMALENGEIDYAELNGTSKEILSANENIEIFSAPTAITGNISMNCASGPFSDPYVRKAVAYAVDREAILKAAFTQEGQVTDYTPIYSGCVGFTTPTADYRYDVEAAKEMLAKSAYPDGFSCTMITGAGDANEKMCAILLNELEAIGIQCEFSATDNQSWMGAIFGGNYDISCYRMSMGTDLQGWDNYLASAMVGICNFGMYSNEEVDSLFAQAAAAGTDTAKRDECFAKLLQILSDELPIMKICEVGMDIAHQKGLTCPTGTDGVAYISQWHW